MGLGKKKNGWLGWRSGGFPRLRPLRPRFQSRQGHYVEWVFSPYLTAWVFPWIIIQGFPGTCKIEKSFPCLLSIGFFGTVIKFALLRVLGFTARINQMKLLNTYI